MNQANMSAHSIGSLDTQSDEQTWVQHVSQAKASPTVLADIYEDNINIAIWQRELAADVISAANNLLQLKPSFKFAATVTAENTRSTLEDALGVQADATPLCEDIAQLVDIFCYLFEIERVGLRLTALDKAMCPRFHVDHVPCRLVTTYAGVATQWLDHQVVDRSKLGAGNHGKPDSQSGLYAHETDIQILNQGEVALLKGERWLGNEGAGLVHRSPSVEQGANRLLLTLDFSND